MTITTAKIPDPAAPEQRNSTVNNAGALIKNTFFFPDIRVEQVRGLMRLAQMVPVSRLREALKTAIAEVNAELYGYRERQIAEGYKRLCDVPAPEINGQNGRVFYYLHAVSVLSAATLFQRPCAAGYQNDRIAESLWRDMRWLIRRVENPSLIK